MTRTNKIFISLVLGAAILSSSALFFFPSIAQQGLTGTLMITIFSTVTLLGTVWYFLTSLKAFKPGLRLAYYMLSAGITLYSFVLAQFLLVVSGLITDIFVLNLMYLIPYSLAAVLIFLGMRKFARLLEIKNIWASAWFVPLLAVIIALLTTQLPHSELLVDEQITETDLDFIMGTLIGVTVLDIGGAVVAMQVRRTISNRYKGAMNWMIVALSMLAFTALHEFVAKNYFFETDYANSDFVLWPFVATSVLFLRSGLAFRQTQHGMLQLTPDASYIDIVVSTAQLVSKPAAVDSELDKLRGVTAAYPDAHNLPKEAKNTLVKLYLYLEDYLITKESLSAFTREGLRDSLPEIFVAELPKPG